MRVVIAGGHGQIALLLEKVLAERGDAAVGIVRNPDHVEDLEKAGAEAVVLDLEQADVDALAEVVHGADAVVFAAGGGPEQRCRAQGDRRQGRGGAARRRRRAGRRTALRDGLRRWAPTSADPDSDDVFQVYLRAKKAADDDLRARDLDWTVVRPGRLTDDPAGRPRAGRPAGPWRDPPRRRRRRARGGAEHRRHDRARRSTCSPGTRPSRRRSPGSEP